MEVSIEPAHTEPDGKVRGARRWLPASGRAPSERRTLYYSGELGGGLETGWTARSHDGRDQTDEKPHLAKVRVGLLHYERDLLTVRAAVVRAFDEYIGAFRRRCRRRKAVPANCRSGTGIDLWPQVGIAVRRASTTSSSSRASSQRVRSATPESLRVGPAYKRLCVFRPRSS